MNSDAIINRFDIEPPSGPVTGADLDRRQVERMFDSFTSCGGCHCSAGRHQCDCGLERVNQEPEWPDVPFLFPQRMSGFDQLLVSVGIVGGAWLMVELLLLFVPTILTFGGKLNA